jgi:OOP family OmpA-OmpF porin
MRISTFAATAAVILLGSTTTWAQGSPSADQIINALKPSGGMLGTTRGIRPAAPSAPAPVYHAQPAAAHATAPGPVVAPPSAAARAPAAEAPSVNLTVQFQNGSAELTPAAMRTLDELGRALSSSTLASFRFRIEGHTDTVGSREYNQALSQERAASVAKYLEQKFGVSAARLEPVGRGQEGLLVSTPDQTPEPRNRRVQVINLGA